MHRYPDILFESQSLTVLINSALYPKTTKIQTKKSSDTQPATRAPRVASGESREWPDLRLSFVISRFLAEIIPVPISPKEPISPNLRGRLRFLLQVTLSASRMTAYFKIQFSKSVPFNFYCVWFST